MKKMQIIFLVLAVIYSVSLLGQNSDQPPVKNKKPDQSKLYNEVFAGYGIGSIYLFTGKVNHTYNTYPCDNNYYGNYSTTDASSPGMFMVGYNRMINRVIMIGFTGSYINLNYSRTYTYSEYNSSNYFGTVNYNDNLLNGMAKLTFNYVNKPKVRVYSGFSMGITVDLSNAQGKSSGDQLETAKKIIPAGQITFMGIRFGRAIGGFCEFGIGTNSIIAAGLNYQFGD
jgi:hypothetical protein